MIYNIKGKWISRCPHTPVRYTVNDLSNIVPVIAISFVPVCLHTTSDAHIVTDESYEFPVIIITHRTIRKNNIVFVVSVKRERTDLTRHFGKIIVFNRESTTGRSVILENID